MTATGGESCPCGSGLAFKDCCGPFLDRQADAPTAEALMRSRYTAFARHDAVYVLATWHASTRPENLDFTGDDTRWMSLRITEVPEAFAADQAEVEFEARCISRSERVTLHERSRFVLEAGRWYYRDGHAQWTRDKLPGRNDPCWCGSGKKFKKCCE